MDIYTKIGLAAILGTSLLATNAKAGLFSKKADSITHSAEHMPPQGHDSRWWVHPSGCEYSRAGRPGEIVWYVIINSIGKRNCPTMIVQKAHADFQL